MNILGLSGTRTKCWLVNVLPSGCLGWRGSRASMYVHSRCIRICQEKQHNKWENFTITSHSVPQTRNRMQKTKQDKNTMSSASRTKYGYYYINSPVTIIFRFWHTTDTFLDLQMCLIVFLILFGFLHSVSSLWHTADTSLTHVLTYYKSTSCFEK